ncbi:fasciclin domain-containing protein [Methanococcoides methylutens]|uniref:Secreted and surface protein containing fasciclin-like repeats n=1 Tax=Methanococcoides methylutens MM1 TaxID=1434104 RepID=A0A0E3X0A7_METMT|nr:fasciclin domain-containing protein [Methanococcoides methylutens]AKB85505.1 Secreted and surface protein containing fasciclin-like repeats [Methanococcoides methylutens MM1]
MSETKTIVQKAIEMGEFTTLVDAAKKLGLDKKFDSDGPYTIFAPMEKAFEPIPDSVIDEAFDDPDYLMDVINNHIVKGKYLISDLMEIGSLTALNDKKLEISKDGDVKINGIPIEKEDIECSNGVIHAIADILIP